MIRRMRRTILEDYNFDVPEGMELIAYNRCRPDGGEARNVDTVDPMCRTVAGVTRIAPDDSGDNLYSAICMCFPTSKTCH